MHCFNLDAESIDHDSDFIRIANYIKTIMASFISAIKNYIHVSQDLEETLSKVIEKLILEKNEFFIREGQYNPRLAYLTQGSIRCHNIVNGNDITNAFLLNNQFVSDFSSLTQDIPCKRNFAAIETCELEYITKEKLFSLSRDFPELREWGAKIAEELFNDSMENQSELRSRSPEERYTHLIQRRPEVIQRVPLQYIASYLGITQVHLSRIRKKVN